MGSTTPWKKVWKDRPKSSSKRAQDREAMRAELEAGFAAKLEVELEKKLEERMVTMREELMAQIKSSMMGPPCMPSPVGNRSSCQSETAPSSPCINPLDTLDVRILYLSILDYNFEL